MLLEDILGSNGLLGDLKIVGGNVQGKIWLDGVPYTIQSAAEPAFVAIKPEDQLPVCTGEMRGVLNQRLSLIDVAYKATQVSANRDHQVEFRILRLVLDSPEPVTGAKLCQVLEDMWEGEDFERAFEVLSALSVAWERVQLRMEPPTSAPADPDPATEPELISAPA